VAFDPDEPMTPLDPDQLAADLASAINRLMDDPALRERMGVAGRRRAIERFSWSSIATRTAALYDEVCAVG
jgi:starch synthase